MKKFIMLVGLPGSGKSTMLPVLEDMVDADVEIISMDNLIEEKAGLLKETYNQTFEHYAPEANRIMREISNQACKTKTDVIWDQTNLTSRKRENICTQFNQYDKLCVFFVPPETSDEWDILYQRLANRPGKSISKEVIEALMEYYEPPSLDEGFDSIIKLDLFGKQIK